MRKANYFNYSRFNIQSKQRGISLVEALVSLVISSVGLLGLVGVHLSLNTNADISKQRSEAVRLAQADMENLRVYRTLGVSSTDPLLWTNLITDLSNSEVTIGRTGNTYSANTNYFLTRNVTTSSVSGFKEIQVRVAWLDRLGASQSVVLRSIVSDIDPSIAMSLSIKPNGSPVRDTLGRDIQIPIPAKSLGDGASVFKQRSDSPIAYVFDNDTGFITKMCSVNATKQNAGINLADLTCTDTNAYLLSGFIRFKNGSFNNTFDPTTANDIVPTGTSWALNMTMNDVAPASGKQGLLSLLSKTSTAWSTSISNNRYTAALSTLPSCLTEPLKTISFTAAVNYTFTNNGVETTATSTTVYLTVPYSLGLTAANIAPYTTYTASQISNIANQTEYYVGYSCIIKPINLDNSLTTPPAWTGLAQLSVSDASLGTSSDTYKVCRFSADYNLNGYVWTPNTPTPSNASTTDSVGSIDNEDHPYAYLNVQKSLSNQNFLVINGNENCPSRSEVEVNGTGSEVYTNATTVLHQP